MNLTASDIQEFVSDIFSKRFDNQETEGDSHSFILGSKALTYQAEANQEGDVEVWMTCAYNEGKDFLTLCALKVYPNDKAYWWEGNHIAYKKTVQIDEGDLWLKQIETVLTDFENKEKQRVDTIMKKRQDRKDRFAYDPNENPDYKLRGGTLVLDVVTGSSGHMEQGEAPSYEDWVKAFEKGTHSSSRVIWRDGKKVIQVVDPVQHRWVDADLETGPVQYKSWDDARILIELVRGEYKILSEEQQKEIGKRRFSTSRILVSEAVAKKKIFRRLYKFGETKDITFLKHNTNLQVELFIGNDVYFEPIGVWVGNNRNYLQALRKAYEK